MWSFPRVRPSFGMEETKIIYYIDDEDTPYLIKLPIPADRVTLGDFKNALNRPNYKFFFKSVDDDFGVVKEEIIDDEAHLPCFNGRVVSWLVPAESSTSDTQSQCTDSQAGDVPLPPTERVGGIGDSRPPSFHANASVVSRDQCDTCTETDSVLSSRRDHPRSSRNPNSRHHPNAPPRMNGHSKHGRRPGHSYESSTVLSSDLDTTSFFDSEDDSRFSTVTETTNRSSSKYGKHRRRRRKHRLPPISRASSFSSITDSTMSLNIITVTLNMDTVNFLGISIVGQSNKGGDGGIYVGSIMKGGAVAQDGRVEPGDMILEVNGVSFENMSNDDAVRTLREAVQKPGPITLVVAKCWDPNPKGYFTVPRQEPVRPIDPSAWVAHTTAMRGDFMNRVGGPSPSLSNMTSTSSSLTSSIPESERFDDLNLTINTDMTTVVKAMAQPDSGLEIRDRMWLKITIPNAFIDLTSLSLEDVDSVSEADRDTLAPLPPPHWNNQYPYSNTSYLPQNLGYIPPYSYTSTDSQSFIGSYVDGVASEKSIAIGGNTTGGGNGSAGSVHSASVAQKDCACIVSTYNQLRKLWENKDKQLYNHKEQQNSTAKHQQHIQDGMIYHRACSRHSTASSAKSLTLQKVNAFNLSLQVKYVAPIDNVSKDNVTKDNPNVTKETVAKDTVTKDLPSVSKDSVEKKTEADTGAEKLGVVQAAEMLANKQGSSASGSSRKEKDKSGGGKSGSPAGSGGSDSETASLASARRMTPVQMPLVSLGTMPQDLSSSRQSFKMAMGNPCEFFVDVM
ncbi:hypothetical protein KUTeg_002071 [Tegillarca granosa]|uniref:Dishevelled n=1 Tax=Tegillarca granosa TaxID=220873 RepID=A0ABQ9FTA1_TEGGR|nr:hypothetical protein KUTeg_002071 [Tegillarca granosa]